MPASTRRWFTEEFKREAVRLVWESAYPVAQVARDLGISDNVLYRWTAPHRQAAAHGTTRQAQRAEAEELTRVKRELARVRSGIVYNVRRRSSRGHRHEIPRDPAARPSRSHPAHVPGARGLGGRL